jgi:hypothetical protein
MPAVFPPPTIALTIHLSADDLPALMSAAEQVAAGIGDPDRIEAVRVDESVCCLEMDIAARPVDPRRLH